jgi:competence protein ComEC
MSKSYSIYLWKKAPFLRLLLPLIAGILLEYYCSFEIQTIIICGGLLALSFIIFSVLPLSFRFKLQPVAGIIITAFIINAGCFLLWNKDIRNHPEWYGHQYDSSPYIVVTIKEPPVEKNKSYKALANIDAVVKNDSVFTTKGKLLIYFSKDSVSDSIIYGSRIIIKHELQEIKNSGNPAAFDYKRYCAFQQIFHQCYLKKTNWVLLKGNNGSFFKQTIFNTQHFVINVINKYITGADEAALAKALLIGYRVDLDKDLVQAYSNAGVIHIIVIAGLHLGLIYILLIWITSKIPVVKKSKSISLILIFVCLWFFALLTGASPPVMRAVVMFSFIAVGKLFYRKASVFNSLSASAFILLCFDPFILWDAGFQLSYFAVTGIVIAQRYIYNWLYVKNKILNEAWKIVSVSLAAQVFTLPALLYYFHQMPLLFLLSNIIAIPLAMFTLYGCVLLVAISAATPVALYLGKLLTGSIWLLNHAVLFINSLPFSLWTGFSLSVTETILLYVIFISFLYWLINKNFFAFKFGLCCVLLFSIMISLNKWNFSQQKKIIVYDVPSHKAIDFIKGNTYQFVGDSELNVDGLLQNFHLKPARIQLMMKTKVDSLKDLYVQNKFYQFCNKRILLIDSAVAYNPPVKKIGIDFIVISKNPKLFIPKLAAVFNCSLYIFDASNPLWKIDKWKKDCEELHLRFHSVPEQGAFIINL